MMSRVPTDPNIKHSTSGPQRVEKRESREIDAEARKQADEFERWLKRSEGEGKKLGGVGVEAKEGDAQSLGRAVFANLHAVTDEGGGSERQSNDFDSAATRSVFKSGGGGECTETVEICSKTGEVEVRFVGGAWAGLRIRAKLDARGVSLSLRPATRGQERRLMEKEDELSGEVMDQLGPNVTLEISCGRF